MAKSCMHSQVEKCPAPGASHPVSPYSWDFWHIGHTGKSLGATHNNSLRYDNLVVPMSSNFSAEHGTARDFLSRTRQAAVYLIEGLPHQLLPHEPAFDTRNGWPRFGCGREHSHREQRRRYHCTGWWPDAGSTSEWTSRTVFRSTHQAVQRAGMEPWSRSEISRC